MSQLINTELSTVCRDVKPVENVAELIENMLSAMYSGKGIGLAANQIGDTRRVIIINTPDFQKVMINPVITRRSGGEVRSVEGCLSFPGIKRTVMRDKQITVEALDRFFTPIMFNLRGIAAMAVQHEIDHLNGITIMEKGR